MIGMSESKDTRVIVNCVSSAGGGLAGYQKSYDGQRSIQWASHSRFAVMFTGQHLVYPQDDGLLIDESADRAVLQRQGSCGIK